MKIGINNIKVQTWLMVSMIGILIVTSIGTGRFLFRWMEYSYVESIRVYNKNFQSSVALTIRTLMKNGDYQGIDRFFLESTRNVKSEVKIKMLRFVDIKGKIIADLHPEKYGEIYSISKAFNAPVEHYPFFEQVKNSDLYSLRGISVISTRNVRWGYLISEIENETYHKVRNNMIWITAAIVGTFALILGFLMRALLKLLIIDPLRNLTRQAGRLTAGDFNHPVRYMRDDEFGNLASVLDDMRLNILHENEKYHVLVDESRDLIFTMNSSAEFLTANKIARRILGYSSDILLKMNLYDLIWVESIEDEKFISNFKSRIERLFESDGNIQQELDLKPRQGNRPVQLMFTLDIINSKGKRIGHGRLSPLLGDMLAENIKQERQFYVLPNDFILSDQLSQRLARRLRYFFDQRITVQIQVCLRELLINAIEHGNLGITFNEKSKYQEEQNYEDFLTERLNDENYKNRQVTVEYELTDKFVRYNITDEGQGFDHHQFMTNIQMTVNEEFRSHGRGLLLTNEVFDEMLFNETGNQVTVIKYLYENCI